MTSPTPIDGLVWSYHSLGWSTRRIAGECNTSQATVVRILDRLKKEPPNGENTVIMATTPPGGIPAAYPMLPRPWEEEEPSPQPKRNPGLMMVAALTLLLIGALAGTLLAANGGMIARGETGPRGPQGVPGPSGPQRTFELCVRYSTYSGAVVSMTAPEKGSCGTATKITIP